MVWKLTELGKGSRNKLYSVYAWGERMQNSTIQLSLNEKVASKELFTTYELLVIYVMTLTLSTARNGSTRWCTPWYISLIIIIAEIL